MDGAMVPGPDTVLSGQRLTIFYMQEKSTNQETQNMGWGRRFSFQEQWRIYPL
jgi:hypothetical protein